jgi:Kelch motif
MLHHTHTHTYIYIYVHHQPRTCRLVSGVWTKKKLPQSKCRYSHTATVVGNWIFFFGGCDGAEYLSELDLLNLGMCGVVCECVCIA